jgi:hypothetical protein
MIGDANECLFKLREPLIKFLEKVLPPVFGANWKNIIFEELKQNPKRNYDEIIRYNDIRKFGELDMAMLINILMDNFAELKYSYNKLDRREYFQYYGKFDNERLVKLMKKHRNEIAHPKTLNIESMNNILRDFIEFGEYIDADPEIIRSIEIIKSEYSEYVPYPPNEKEKTERNLFIENEVIRPALNNKELDEDIRNSVLTTLFRLRNKKTAKEIDEFFIEAQSSKRGVKVKEELNKLGLKAFEDISDEYTKKFIHKEI